MKKIKNIIVAIDFSVTARNAYRYAKGLAASLGAELTLVHVKEHLVIVSDVMIAPFPSDYKDLIKDMEELVAEENKATPQVNLKQEVKIEVLTGDPANALIEFSENENVDLIVIGTTGLSDVLTKLFGSISLKVSNKSLCPVILVPREAKWQTVEQILFASDFDSMNATFVNKISDFAVNIGAHIHFVNVRNYDPILEPKQKDIDWNELLVDSAFLTNKKATVYGNDTVNALKKYSDGYGIHLLAFASKHRNFWENLAHKSITENMALSTIKPLMVMHLDD